MMSTQARRHHHVFIPSQRTQTVIAALVLASQIFICVTGAIVRVTASGLGCPTWPQCFPGSFVPLPHTAVPRWHQAIEFTNRQIAVWLVTVASILIVVAVYRAQRSKTVKLYAWLMPLGTVIQAVLGGITVKAGLRWWTVALHMLASLLLIVWAAQLFIKVKIPDDLPTTSDRYLVHRLTAALFALGVLAASGTMVTGAGPHAGDDSIAHPVERLNIPIEDLISFHTVMLLIYLALLAPVALAIKQSHYPELHSGFRLVVISVIFQAAVGITQFSLHVPSVLVVVHVFGAACAAAALAALKARSEHLIRSPHHCS